MGRQIIGGPANVDATAHSTQNRNQPDSAFEQRLGGPRLATRLRQKRSKRYIEGIGKIDVSHHLHDQQALDQLLESISAEFPDLTIEQRPLGIVAKCYLGHPYEVHICDLAGGIVEHFEVGRPMAQVLERARSLARHRTYSFIEVYADTLRAVSEDGSISVIER